MANLDSQSRDGYSGCSANSASITCSCGESISFQGSLCPHMDAHVNDAARIARDIFTAEIADLIVVLRNCGALRTREECFWCVHELWRLLSKPSPSNLT
jgi:hypothetical protein